MISIASDFSEFPAGRYKKDGPYSGEEFRDRVLAPALKTGNVIVDLDGVIGYGSSFLEEAFGGLVRVCGFAVAKLRSTLTIKSSDPSYVSEIWEYIDAAGR